MITLTHGERCRTPFRRDPRPYKTRGGGPSAVGPWPPDHTPRARVPAGVRLSERNPNQPSTLASEIFIIDLNMLKNGLISR